MTAPPGRTLENRKKEVVSMTAADPAVDGLQDQMSGYPDYVIDTMARVMLPALRAFYASPEGRAAFEEWKRNQEHT